MTPSRLQRLVRASLLVGALALGAGLPATAVASGLSLLPPGTLWSGPASSDPAAWHFNPAGAAFLPGSALHVSGGLVVGNIRYTRERLAQYQYPDSFDFALPINQDRIDPSLTGPADSVSSQPIAPIGEVFGVLQPGADSPFRLGLGIYTPYGAILNMPSDGPQRWQIEQVTILNLAITPAVAWQISDQFSVGVSMPTYAGTASLRRTQDLAEVGILGDAISGPPINQVNDFGPDAPPAVRELDVLSRPFVFRDGRAFSPTFAVGAMLRPSERFSAGVSYTHRARMNYRGEFQLDMNDDFFTQDVADQGLQYDALVTGDASLAYTLPWTARAGIQTLIGERHTVFSSLAVVGWNTVDSFDLRTQSAGLAQPEVGLPDTLGLSIPRNWNRTVEIDAAHAIDFGARLSWIYSLGWHSPASPDEWMDLAAIDGQRLIWGTGVRVHLNAGLSLVADLRGQNVLQRTVANRRYDTANGTYGLTLMRANAALQWVF